jgi:hypothetical protein
MAAPQTNTQQSQTVDFPANVPVTLSLAYPEGRIVAGHFGERVMYTTTEKRRFFVDPPVAAQITELGINVRENFTITRKPAGRKGAPDTWEVARVAGEQPNGTLVFTSDEPTKAAGQFGNRRDLPGGSGERTGGRFCAGAGAGFTSIWRQGEAG